MQLPSSLATIEANADLLGRTGTSAAGYPEYTYLSSNSGLINLTDYPTSTTATSTTPGQMEKTGLLPGEPGVMNQIAAAAEGNQERWLETHNVRVGRPTTFYIKSVCSCLNWAFWLENYTFGTLARAKQNHVSYGEQLGDDLYKGDVDKLNHDPLLLMGPGWLMYNPTYTPARGTPG